MNIIPEPLVVLLQVIPFLVTVVALQKIIFGPMLAHLKARSQATQGAQADAEALQSQCNDNRAAYDQRLAKARADMSALRAQRRTEATKKYNAEIDAARKTAEGEINLALEALQAERAAAQEQIGTISNALADQIAGRILLSVTG